MCTASTGCGEIRVSALQLNVSLWASRYQRACVPAPQFYSINSLFLRISLFSADGPNGCWPLLCFWTCISLIAIIRKWHFILTWMFYEWFNLNARDYFSQFIKKTIKRVLKNFFRTSCKRAFLDPFVDIFSINQAIHSVNRVRISKNET